MDQQGTLGHNSDPVQEIFPQMDLQGEMRHGQPPVLQVLPMAHMNLQLQNFYGNPGDSAETWLEWFFNYAAVHQLNEQMQLSSIPFYLKSHASVWYSTQAPEVKGNLPRLVEAMKSRFDANDNVYTNYNILTMQQNETEKAATYFTRLLEATHRKNLPMDMIKAIVMPQQHQELEALRKACITAEQTLEATRGATANVSAAVGSDISSKMDELINLIKLQALQRETSQEVQSNPAPPQTYSRGAHRGRHNFNRRQYQHPHRPHQSGASSYRGGGRPNNYNGRPFHVNCRCPNHSGNNACKKCRLTCHYTESCPNSIKSKQ